jgi:hypothetical protein
VVIVLARVLIASHHYRRVLSCGISFIVEAMVLTQPKKEKSRREQRKKKSKSSVTQWLHVKVG